MTLREKQSIFADLVAYLLDNIYEKGYEATLGECYRSPEEAARLAKTGAGIKNSVHTLRLAIDINLFKDGVYLTDSADYQQFGDFWKLLSRKSEGINCCWGGDFKKKDGNHFSIEHNGVK